ncbi:MAG: phosphoribosylpyrophosphate synthetase [Clostridiales bacterium]
MDIPKDDQKIHMNTLSEVMNKMREKGYEYDFQMTDLGLSCKKTNEVFKPEELVIKGVYRFEGESNPDDMSVLYTIAANSGTKGLLVDTFGAYSSVSGMEFAEFMKKVKREDDRP